MRRLFNGMGLLQTGAGLQGRLGRLAVLLAATIVLLGAAGLLPRPALATTPVPGASGEPLDAAQAFRFSSRALDERTLELRWDIEPGYYMYRSKLKITAPPGITAGTPEFVGEPLVKDDPNFGRMEIDRGRMRLRLPYGREAGAAVGAVLRVTGQGCADLGLCYPPFTHEVRLDGTDAAPANAVPATAAEAVAATPAAPASAAAPGLPQDESGRIAGLLQGRALLPVLASFFGFGLLLALTPCVFPMIPILSSIIVGQGGEMHRARAAGLSLAYVLGMAVTYTAAGVAAGLSGSMLSAALQNPWVLGGFAGVFVLLSLSMFGVYELQLPASLQGRLNQRANGLGGSWIGVALMGALSALIVGPCVAAPLAGALLYIARTGDAVLGGAALFMLALGMGAPLLLVGLAAGSLLPRVGLWMESVKRVFGVLLLATALWLLSPVLPVAAVMLLLSALLIGCAVQLHALDPLPADASGWRRLGKGLGVMAVLAGAALLVGALAGARDPLQPLAALRGGGGPAVAAVQPAPAFERVADVAALEARLTRSVRPVMLDFYADWCVSCKEMEHLTFGDPQVRERLARFELLQVDVTANSAADQALLKRFSLFGPPGLVFFAPGQATEMARVVGFQDVATFARVLDGAATGPSGAAVAWAPRGRP